MRSFALFLDPSDFEKKKVASRSPISWHFSAIDCAIEDLPAPAGPLSHIISASRSSRPHIHSIILSRMASLVRGWHFGASKRSLELWKALWATCSIRRSKPVNHRHMSFRLIDGGRNGTSFGADVFGVGTVIHNLQVVVALETSSKYREILIIIQHLNWSYCRIQRARRGGVVETAASVNGNLDFHVFINPGNRLKRSKTETPKLMFFGHVAGAVYSAVTCRSIHCKLLSSQT